MPSAATAPSPLSRATRPFGCFAASQPIDEGGAAKFRRPKSRLRSSVRGFGSSTGNGDTTSASPAGPRRLNWDRHAPAIASESGSLPVNFQSIGGQSELLAKIQHTRFVVGPADNIRMPSVVSLFRNNIKLLAGRRRTQGSDIFRFQLYGGPNIPTSVSRHIRSDFIKLNDVQIIRPKHGCFQVEGLECAMPGLIFGFAEIVFVKNKPAQLLRVLNSRRI